ncbi:lipid kinase [Shouchella lehensis G1]|uniref:Lipid kinase n=2 Tax=Shouchella lehensis TaxID=300825 RepID=A0A060M1U0_9BACI|nr:lipid kinase [Shouchella lehensis G1]
MTMYSKAMLIYNQAAGQGELEDLLKDIVPKLAPSIKEFTLYQTEKAGDTEALCVENGSKVDLILIMGGDGTVHECVNGLMQQAGRPTVGILPTGTCNDLSRSLNCSKLEDAVDAILAGQTTDIDIISQNDRYFSNFSGVGLITEASKEIEESTKESFGKLGYIISAIRSLKEPTPFSYEVTTNTGIKKSGEAVMIVAMNGQYIGTVGLFKDVISLNDGILHMIIVKEAGATLLKNMYNQARTEEGWLDDPEQLEMLNVSQCSLTTSPVLDIDSDGEKIDNTPVTYLVHEKALTFIHHQ